MKPIVLGLLLSIHFGQWAVNHFESKRKCIEYRIEIDGRRVEEELHASFVVDGKEIETRSDKVSIQVPAEAESATEVGVRLRFGTFDLAFPEVFSSQIDGMWVIGIDRQPFDKSNVTLLKEKPSRIDYIYFIKFYPTEGASTGVISYEKRKSKKGQM